MSLYHLLKQRFFPTVAGIPDYVPQFRLEGRSRDSVNEPGLEMRIADPLWMLARQWQFGEFQGEDNGSPISIKASYRKEKTFTYSFRGKDEEFKLGRMPLEAKVEAIAEEPSDLRSKVRIGQQFEALIRSHFPADTAEDFIQRLRVEFPLVGRKIDEKSRGFFELMAGHVIDGGNLWKQIQVNEFPYGGFQALKTVAEELENWYYSLFVKPEAGSAWRADHLVHQFSVHGQENIRLDAPDYQSGHLDWYSFDKASIGIDPLEQSVESEALFPVNVSFAAMPEKRLFSFEDNKLDLSGMEVDRSDLVRLMILDFSLVSAPDWFTIPLRMDLGELCWVNHITVKDVFGVQTIIKNEPGSGLYVDQDPLKVWDCYKIRRSEEFRLREMQDLHDKKDHFLYLAPATGHRQESTPVEELLFLRDEYANMVWAVEKIVRNSIGKPTNGYDLHLELNGQFLPEEEEATDEEGTNMPRFRLASPVPTNWIPYLPFHLEDSEGNRSLTDIELRRAVMVRNQKRDAPEDINPISRLAAQDLLRIREEAIPRAGLRVQLTRQRIRWTDGKTYIWLGRKVLAGRGEGSSGLTFDQLLT